MITIVHCSDPLFSVRNAEGRINWEDIGAEAACRVVTGRARSGETLAIPYAEHMIKSDAEALAFIEAAAESSAAVTLYCRSLALPETLLRYAIISQEHISYDTFQPEIESLPFLPDTRRIIRENLDGFPFSKVNDLLTAASRMEEPAALHFILESKRNLLKQSQTLEVMDAAGGVTDIGGLPDLKQWIVERRSNFSDKARAFGIPMPKGMLLLGVQGCGKSLTAKVISNIWNFPLVRLDFVNLFRQGRSVEELIREAVQTVEAFAPIVLWIDEIEKALFQENQSVEIRRVLGWLMTWMQEKSRPVFLVATANNVEVLPPELLRKGRFDEIFFVDLPSKEEREEIFKIHIARRGRKPENFDLSKLAAAADHFSGAEIEQAVIDSLIIDFSKERELNQKTLEEAVRRTVPLSVTYEESIKKLRIWARGRARNASGNARIESLFNSGE